MEKRLFQHSRQKSIEEERIQKSEKTVPIDQLPFDLTKELGAVIRAEEICPGVYSIVTDELQWGREYYVVTGDAPAISDKARSYGQEFAGKPDLRVYNLDQLESGRHIIDFEIIRYQKR